MRKISWLVLSVVGWLLLLGCSAETATQAEPTAIPPTDIPATVPAEFVAEPTAPTEAVTQGTTLNGYTNVIYTEDDAALLAVESETLKFAQVYATW